MDRQTLNIVSAIASVFVPGLGHLFKGRILRALAFFFGIAFSIVLMVVLIGFITTPAIWLFCVYDAFVCEVK